MYDIGDEDLARNYDPKKVAANSRTAKLPEVDGLNIEAVLKRVSKERAPKAGNLYAFKFVVTKSNNELVPVGGTYSHAFFPGKSDVDNNMFWEKVTPLLMAVTGETNVLTFNAAEKLGELMAICKDENITLDLGFRQTRELEECRPGKDGIVKHKNADGTPKKFPRDVFLPASAG